PARPIDRAVGVAGDYARYSGRQRPEGAAAPPPPPEPARRGLRRRRPFAPLLALSEADARGLAGVARDPPTRGTTGPSRLPRRPAPPGAERRRSRARRAAGGARGRTSSRRR